MSNSASLARARRQGQMLGRRRQRISERDLETVAGLSVREAADRLGVPPSRVHSEAAVVGSLESPQVIEDIGAGDGDRTRDIELGKLAFYR